MPAFSSTCVQNTMKVGVITIFADIAFDGSGNPILITADGVSKGVKSITRPSTGTYVLTLDDSIPVKNWLGAPNIELYFPAGATSTYRLIADRTTGTNATLTIRNYSSGGTLTNFATTTGRWLMTMNITTSPVF